MSTMGCEHCSASTLMYGHGLLGLENCMHVYIDASAYGCLLAHNCCDAQGMAFKHVMRILIFAMYYWKRSVTEFSRFLHCNQLGMVVW